MEKSSEHENTCDVFMNEVRIEDEMLLEHEEMGSLRTKGSRNLEMKEFKEITCTKNILEKIAKMHCVGHFIVLMITKKLM
jgi:hypothetical protein